MEGFNAPSLSSPEEELAYLRAEVERKERELAAARQEMPREQVIESQVIRHTGAAPERVLASTFQLPKTQIESIALALDPESDDETMGELRAVMEEHGIRNAFSVLEKLNSPHLEDDFHRFLVQYLASGMSVKGFSEGQPTWKALHMTLYEIALPEPEGDKAEGRNKTLKELISAMEQFYAGMLSVDQAYANEPAYFTLELAVPAGKPHLLFYASVPNGKKDLFEKQLLAIFPNAQIAPQPNDYNVFTQDGSALASVASLTRAPMLPLKDYADFDYDPINAVLNAFAKIEENGEGASVQILIRPAGDRYTKHYTKVLSELRKGEPIARAFKTPETALGEVGREFRDVLFNRVRDNKEKQGENRTVEANKSAIEQVEKKVSAPIAATNIRIAVSSRNSARTLQMMGELEAAFNQFGNTLGNQLHFTRLEGSKAKNTFRDFSFRVFSESQSMPLSLRELTTIFHFPPQGIESSPHLKQARFKTAPAPIGLPVMGTALGINTYRGKETEVYMEPADRLRHLYAIGQTGTGKTSFMKTLINQDIKAGNGVCFIDPHGNDILDVLAAIPPERYEDVIYFDPAYTPRPFGLNLLEYDPNYPEQKTFIVNEILAIFRRLYGDVPESLGPMFEQYFRNATLLVMEDPASGSTLMDIGRVLSDEGFRNMKLSRSMNPVVNQFWYEIAGKAGGDASLENIVPYITNKFDDFTANDFMRPIIGQQYSSFKFRDVMDSKKILLVNLSKGRLGERNANLIGLILVGKIFMAALSRADNPRGDFPPFYLYIDEFQNITTDSIPGILSEARKYKLSLTIAHQYLAQIEEKIRDAVFGNVGSMAVFRVGEEDAEFFAKQYAPTFDALDFVNIENYNAYVKILAKGVPQKPFNIKSLNPVAGNPGQVDDLRELSYLTYGRDRATIESMIRERYLS